MHSHHQLRAQWGTDTHSADPYTTRHHRNQQTPQRSNPTLPTHTHQLPNHNRQRAPGDHHRSQQPTPKTTRPDNTSRNPPTPHTITPPQCCTSDLNTAIPVLWCHRARLRATGQQDTRPVHRAAPAPAPSCPGFAPSPRRR